MSESGPGWSVIVPSLRDLGDGFAVRRALPQAGGAWGLSSFSTRWGLPR
jgi:hypothetical protein